MEQIVILSGVRTPMGRFMGGLAGFSAIELGAKVVAEAVKRARVEPAQVDEVIMGNVVAAGLGQNPARQAALRGGLPNEVAALTINKVCGSGCTNDSNQQRHPGGGWRDGIDVELPVSIGQGPRRLSPGPR